MANDTARTQPLRGAEMVGFIVTNDAAKCRAFYEGRLGFRFASEDPFAIVFDAHGRMIRAQKASPQGFVARQGTVLGWNVADIEATATDLAAAGVALERFGFPGQDERGIMTFPDGARVAWFKDPDGNVLSVAQMPR